MLRCMGFVCLLKIVADVYNITDSWITDEVLEDMQIKCGISFLFCYDEQRIYCLVKVYKINSCTNNIT